MAKEDWLNRQLEIVRKEVDNWSDWKKSTDKGTGKEEKPDPE